MQRQTCQHTTTTDDGEKNQPAMGGAGWAAPTSMVKRVRHEATTSSQAPDTSTANTNPGPPPRHPHSCHAVHAARTSTAHMQAATPHDPDNRSPSCTKTSARRPPPPRQTQGRHPDITRASPKGCHNQDVAPATSLLQRLPSSLAHPGLCRLRVLLRR